MQDRRQDRFDYIDFIRTVAIIFIIVIHTLSFHLYDRLIFLIWNYLHFVVVALVFSSGYVLTFRYKNYFTSFSKTLSWYKKRLVRLLLPFYYYLIAHYLLWYYFPNFFNGLGLKKGSNFIIQSILLIGGVDFNWFALLFVQLTILFPLAIQIIKRKPLSILLLFLSIASALYFPFNAFRTVNYRFLMWMPWMSIIFFSIYIWTKEFRDSSKRKTIKRHIIIGVIAFILFFLFARLVTSSDKELVLTRHKYPPDVIYLAYGIALACFLMVLARSKFLYKRFLGRIYRYISERSYQLFFLHYLALDFTFKTTNKIQFWSNPLTQTILVILLSLGVMFFIDTFNKTLSKKLKIITSCLILLVFILFWFINKNFISCITVDKNPVAKSAIFEWLQKPAAVRFVGKYDRTYISWIENSGKIQMRFYDHKNKTFSNIYTVDDLYLDYGIEAQDDHNAPNLLILPDGQLLVFYVVHDVNGAFFMKKSKNLEDISSWGERVNIADRDSNTPYNYPQAKRLDNGEIILFFRRGVYYNSDWYFKISKDNGMTWEDSVKLIDFGDEGVYAFIFSRGMQIHIAWNKAVSRPPKKNVYYVFSPDGGVSWRKRDGAILSLPIVEEKADLVFDSGKDPAYVWDIVADAKSNPYIVFAYKNDPDHEFRFTSWEGSAWSSSKITSSSLHYDSGHFFSGGIVVDPNNVYQVYLSKKNSKLEIESWESSDHGQTWNKSESITKNSSVDNFRPQIVQNYREDLRLVWSSGSYEGLIDSQWSGFSKVNIQSEATKSTIPKQNCQQFSN